MRRRLFMTSVALIALLSGNAQQLKVINENVDCGKVAYEKPVTAEFELLNSGSFGALITDVHPSCGCTKVEYPKETVAAGATCKIKLTYDSRMLGHFNKSALVFVSGMEQPLELTMVGEVLAELKDYTGEYPYTIGGLLADKDVLEFDDVNRGDTPEQVIYVHNNGTETVYPSMLHLPSYLSSYSTPSQLKPGQGGQVYVKLNSAALRDYGLTQTTVYLGSKPGEKVSEEKEMPVSVVLLPSFGGINEAQKKYAPKLVLSDETLKINFEGKKRKNATVILTNNGRTTLKISSLQLFTGGMKVTLNKRELAPGESTTLKVTAYRDELKKVKGKPRVLMITNDPDKAKVVINLTTNGL